MIKKSIWVITILWMAIIFYFSHQPGDVSRKSSGEILVKMDMANENDITDTHNSYISKLQKIIRKSAHFIAYFTLGGLITLSILLMKFKFNNHNIIYKHLIAWLLTTIYAATDEIHQSFIPGRGPQLKDVFLDSIGALVAVVIVFLGIKVLKRFNLVNNI